MNLPTPQPLRSIVTLGAGIVGLSAAIAFRRALPNTPIKVVVTPNHSGALADRQEVAPQSILQFHRRIGMDEAGMFQRAGGSHWFATRFKNWNQAGGDWLYTHGKHGVPVAQSHFHQHWLRLEDEGSPYHAHSLAGALALAGRFKPLLASEYSLRFNLQGYLKRLVSLARHVGITFVPGTLVSTTRSADGKITSITLSDQQQLSADLFLDCAGPQAPLLSTLEDQFEDWSQWIPCDRQLLDQRRTQCPPDLIDTITALPDGWRWNMPGQNGLHSSFNYHSSFTSENAAAACLRTDELDAMAFRPGRRTNSWVHNVVAFGDAAATPGPLYGSTLQIAHESILRALELLPGRDCQPNLIAEYNRRTALADAVMRDFHAWHYRHSGQPEGPMWRAAQESPPPESLAHRLEQFLRRGSLPHYAESAITIDNWRAALIGLGLRPTGLDPAVHAVDKTQSRAILNQSSASINRVVQDCPAYTDALPRIASSKSQA